MTNKEKLYDDDIAPVLAELCRLCEERGLSFLAVCEWEPGETGLTSCFAPGSGYGIRLAYAGAKSHGNVDSLMIAIERHALKHGHSSLFLSTRGVPLTPPPGPEEEQAWRECDGECPDCGNSPVESAVNHQTYTLDGDTVRCDGCGLRGAVSCDSETPAQVEWVDPDTGKE